MCTPLNPQTPKVPNPLKRLRTLGPFISPFSRDNRFARMPGFAPDNCLFRLKFSLVSQLAHFVRSDKWAKSFDFNKVGENLILAVEVVHPACSLRCDNKELTFNCSLACQALLRTTAFFGLNFRLYLDPSTCWGHPLPTIRRGTPQSKIHNL